MSDSAEHHDHSPKKYIKIYAILVVLFIISFVGPELGIKWLTLITAFGIALVKAWMVCSYFMHLNIEKKYIWYMLTATCLLLLVMFAGLAPDSMKPSGQNWENLYVEPTEEEYKAHDHDHEHGHDEDSHH